MVARRIVYLAVFLCIVGCGNLARADLVVVCNSTLNLDEVEIKEVFLGGKQFSNGIKLVPVDNAAAQEEFLAKVLQMNSVKYATLWTKKSFRDGTRQPSQKIADTDVLDFVRRTPGGVGYVRSIPSGVKVIKKY